MVGVPASAQFSGECEENEACRWKKRVSINIQLHSDVLAEEESRDSFVILQRGRRNRSLLATDACGWRCETCRISSTASTMTAHEL